MAPQNNFDLRGVAIVTGRRPPETIELAGRELARFLFRLTGRPSPVTTALPARGTAVVLDPGLARTLGVTAEPNHLADQGYRLATAKRGGTRHLVIAAPRPVGVLYGAYGLLEKLGMGFYAGGETYPARPIRAALPADLDETAKPAFAVRGNMLHYNFLCGCTDWGLEDYRFYYDQLARMRCNLLLMHWYDGEPGAASEFRGEYLTGGVTPNSLTKPWGAVASLRTSEFAFDTGRFYDAEIYTSPMGESLPDLLTEIRESERVWSEASRYARAAGIQVAAGFEEPPGDPTDPGAVQRFQARISQFLARNPYLTHFALWQHESGACYGSTVPESGTDAAGLLEQRRSLFTHLGCETRIWQAVRYGRFAEIAIELVRHKRPDLRFVVVGWGGDRWMRFSDLCLGFDQWLPPEVIFTCHDNIDASFGPNVSSGWGQLPATRERWAMPWVEGDIDECWVRQPNVESLGKLAPDALQKGCQGLLTLQWRTRDVEEETGFIARYAWDTSLTPDRFYQDFARHAFGTDHQKEMGKMIGDLQRLGSRWTGVRGTVECGAMRWTGWVPHLPFDLDASVADFLLKQANEVLDALMIVPPEETGGGAFHERPDTAGDQVGRDPDRFGTKELRAIIARLQVLRGVSDENRLREELRSIEEDLWKLRTPLIERGMHSQLFRTFDGFVIAMHHLQRNAGASWKIPLLEKLRRRLERLRASYVREGRVERLERLDYLAATMDFVLGYDRAAMRLADGEMVDQALAEAGKADQSGDKARAATIAGAALETLRDAGLKPAVEAFTRKLTTRCDFGTLTTLNVKALPVYWETIGRLEALLPAAPPRKVTARGQHDEVWLSWDRSPRANGLNLYRRRGGRGAWNRINAKPLAGSCVMFVDRPARPGDYEYAVTALAEDGWESPRSHPARATCGSQVPGPRIVGIKPAARLSNGDELEIRAVVVSDRSLEKVTACWRAEGETKWHRAPMGHRFRNAYGVTIPASELRSGTWEYCVEATGEDGKRTVWPESTTVGLPWSVVVMG